MENLIFRTSNNKLVGVVWIVGGLGLLIIRITRKEIADPGDWTTPIVFCIMGIIFFTPLVGSDKAKIEISDQSLRIRWINWYRTVTVMEDEIESIILASNGVMIKRKDNKPLKIKREVGLTSRFCYC